jgi:uncharacterized protein
MHSMIFVNLPVADLEASRAFFTALGYRFDEPFCDDDALCLRLGVASYAMLLRQDFFARFAPGAVADARKTTEMTLCLSVGSRPAVDALVEAAEAAGGVGLRRVEQADALGATCVYGRSYADLDGHVWEIIWTDPGYPGAPEVS